MIGIKDYFTQRIFILQNKHIFFNFHVIALNPMVNINRIEKKKNYPVKISDKNLSYVHVGLRTYWSALIGRCTPLKQVNLWLLSFTIFQMSTTFAHWIFFSFSLLSSSLYQPLRPPPQVLEAYVLLTVTPTLFFIIRLSFLQLSLVRHG